MEVSSKPQMPPHNVAETHARAFALAGFTGLEGVAGTRRMSFLHLQLLSGPPPGVVVVPPFCESDSLRNTTIRHCVHSAGMIAF